MNWDLGQSVYLWLALGLILVLSEIVIPGGVVMFLGLSAFIVGLSIHFDWVENWVHALTMWFFTSLVLIVVFRDVVQRMVGGDESRDNTDEDFELTGMVAESIEEIGEDQEGRIRFRGSTWSAKSKQGKILAGQSVKILSRDNVTYIVEPLADSAGAATNKNE